MNNVQQKGYNAYWDEIDVGDNPFEFGSTMYFQWLDGWLDAKEEVELNVVTV